MRAATGRDRDGGRAVPAAAFPEGERERVAGLAVELLADAGLRDAASLTARGAAGRRTG